jgi:CubicO group peptidase (beta-lactamase class C family)
MAGRAITRRNVLKAAIGFGASVGVAGMPWPRVFAAPRVLVPRQLGGYPWQARHGLDAAAHQAEFDSLSAQGYRLLRVSGCSVDNVAYYASIWEQSPGPAFVARHGIDGTTYQSEFDTWVGQGYRLVDVSGFELDGADHYAAIWYQGVDFPFGANHGLTNPDYQAAVDRYIAEGYRPLHVSGYTVNGEDRYATIWEQSPGPAFVARHGLDAAAYQAEFDARAAGGFRVVDVSGYNIGGTDYYAAIFEADPGGAWVARHGLDATAYQADFDDLADQGYRLRVVSGFGSNGTVRYATVWNEGPGGLRTATDRIAQTAIANASVPAVSVAIARNGQLVYARAFGMADAAANEAVTVDHRFRIASISKPITSAAIMTLVENGQLTLADTVFGTGAVLGTQYGTQPYPNGLTTITVQHLLEHTSGGWPNQTDDPMFAEPARFGAAFITWVIDNTGPGKRFALANAPGTNFDYSNFGYCLLGRVVEEVTGQSYDSYVQGAVLAPCGITGMEIAGDTLADRRPGEVVYDGTNAQPAWGQPYTIPVTRMDAHGGWIATAVDLLRFVTRVDRFTTVPDILADPTLATMTTPSAARPVAGTTSGYALGWDINQFGNWWHTGRLAGTESILVRSNDGICWAAIANGNGIDLETMGWDMVNQLATDGWPAGTPL